MNSSHGTLFFRKGVYQKGGLFYEETITLDFAEGRSNFAFGDFSLYHPKDPLPPYRRSDGGGGGTGFCVRPQKPLLKIAIVAFAVNR